MKKGSGIMLLVCAFVLTLVTGIFCGRNLRDHFVTLPQNIVENVDEHSEISLNDYRVDINNATKAQLMELPGIGETLADRILAYRMEHGDFNCVDDLMNIDGIGEKKLLQMEYMITVGG